MDKEIVYWMKMSTEMHAGFGERENVPDGAVIISEEAYLYLRGKSVADTDSIIRELDHAASEQEAKFNPTPNEMRYP